MSETVKPETNAEKMVQFSLAQPDKVPAKFRKADGSIDVDVMLQSYTELERRQSNAAAPETAVTVEDPATAVAETPKVDTSIETLLQGMASLGDDTKPADNATLDAAWTAAEMEASTGSMSQASVDALVAAGATPGMVSLLTTQAKTVQNQRVAAATELAGSEENLQKVLSWAKAKLPADERQVLAQSLAGPSAMLVMQGLIAQARAGGAFGEQGTLQSVAGHPPVSSNAALREFTDGTEYLAAMQNPLYTTDPEYRRTVAKRYAITVGKDPARFDSVPM